MLLTKPAPQNQSCLEEFQINGPIPRHLVYQLTRLKKSPWILEFFHSPKTLGEKEKVFWKTLPKEGKKTPKLVQFFFPCQFLIHSISYKALP